MNRLLRVTRLHLNKPSTFIITPISIIALVMLVSIIIVLVIQRVQGPSADVASADYIEGARWNQGIIWSLPGFLTYYGVQAVATTYPFALVLGTTRRNFILGTMLANLVQSAFVAVLLVVLLGVEVATDHWFLGAYVLDVYSLGAGNPWVLMATAFLGTLFFLTVGGLFAAVWVRFGSKGPVSLGLGLALAVAVALLILAPALGDIFATLTRAALALAAVVVIAAALVATWFAMRRASVR